MQESIPKIIKNANNIEIKAQHKKRHQHEMQGINSKNKKKH